MILLFTLIFPTSCTDILLLIFTFYHHHLKSIDALVEAVKGFRGGLIVVSHDEHFITNTCEELWVVGEGVVAKYKGGFDDYKKETLTRTAKRVAESVKQLSAINN